MTRADEINEAGQCDSDLDPSVHAMTIDELQAIEEGKLAAVRHHPSSDNPYPVGGNLFSRRGRSVGDRQ